MCELNISVSIVIRLQADNWVSIHGKSKDLSLLHHIQTTSGAHPASCPVGTGDSYLTVKQPGLDVDHSPPYSAKVKNTQNHTSTPPYVLMAWCLFKYRDKFSLSFQ
jgi:hypothetical protein